MQKLSNISGKLRWQKIIEKQLNITPLAFNPSLYNFYKNHFNWKPYYIILTINEQPLGLLPIIFTGKAWTSMPHFSHGGVLFINGENYIKPSSIITSVISFVKKETPGFFTVPVENLENNNDVSKDNYFIRTSFECNDNEFVRSEKAVSYMKLCNEPDAQWSQLSNNLRRKIKKAENELVVKIGNEELLKDFYKVYTDNISQLGSLTYGLGYFRDLISCFKDNNSIMFVAYLNDIPIGGALLASYGNYFENLYFATRKDYRHTYVSDFLHWEMIKYSINKIKDAGEKFNSISVYSFGRSTIDSGVYNYKNHWPVVNQELYNFTNMSAISKNKKLLKIWKHMPQFVTVPLGARLIKHVY